MRFIVRRLVADNKSNLLNKIEKWVVFFWCDSKYRPTIYINIIYYIHGQNVTISDDKGIYSYFS